MANCATLRETAAASAVARIPNWALVMAMALMVVTCVVREKALALQTVAASAAPAVRISWPGVVGRQYQLRASAGLRGWVDFGGVATGAGEVMSTTDLMTPGAQFYRVDDITP